jgi:O-antigen ligase
MLSTGVVFAFAMLIKHFWVFGSWTSLIIYALAVGVIGLIVNMMIVLNKNDRAAVMNKVKRKFKKC